MWNRHLDAYYAGRDDYFGEDEDEYYPDDDYGGGYSGGYNSAEEDGYDDYYDPLGYLASRARRSRDDETSTNDPRRRIFRPIREYGNYSYTESWFTSVINQNLNMDVIKAIMKENRVPIGYGNKATITAKLAAHLYSLYQAKDAVKFNALVDRINAGRRNPGYSSYGTHLKHYPDTAGYCSSMQKSHKFDPYLPKLPESLECVKTLVSPVFTSFFSTANLSPLTLEFDYKKPVAVSGKVHMVALVVCKCYDYTATVIDKGEAWTPEDCKMRMSFGSNILRVRLNGAVQYIGYNDGRHASGIPMRVFPAKDLKEGKNTLLLDFYDDPKYLIMVLELLHDNSVKVRTVEAAEVTRTFLEAQAKKEVATTSIQLSLRCPISFIRMKEPVRFAICSHLQCVDRSAWDAMVNERSPKCPICARAGEISRVVVDGFTQSILLATTEDVDAVTVDIEAGCTWSVPQIPIDKENLEPAHLEADPALKPIVEEIWIDLYDDDTVYDTPWVEPVKPDPGLPEGMPSIAVAVVDLTSAQASPPRIPARRPAGASLDDAIELF